MTEAINNISDNFYKCQGRLADLPTEYKCWKTLNEYRSEWSFLPYSLRYRVAEQCMACDYLMSMEIWLQPGLTIQQSQKIMLIQGLSSIYEGVLSCLLDNVISNEKQLNSLFKTCVDKEKYDCDNRTFGPTLRACIAAGLIDESWSSYLGQIREIRNWIHLSNETKGPLLSWVNGQTCHDFRIKLNEFNKFIIKKYVKKNS